MPGKTASPLPSSSSAPRQSTAPHDPFEGIGAIRRALAPMSPPRRHLTDRGGYFALLFGGPAAVIAVGGLVELLGRLRKRWAARGRSAAALSRRALLEAKEAAKRSDAFGVAGAVERAVYSTIEERLGLKARAVLRERLAAELSLRGSDGALSSDIVAVLDACDTLRFASGPEATPDKIIEQGASVVARLARAARPNLGEQAA